MNPIYSDLISWHKASKAEKEESLNNLPAHITANYSFKEFTGAYELAVFTYKDTEHEFVLIPGGKCNIGFTVDDVFCVLQALKASERKQALEESYPSDINEARPARTVHFKPFLVSKEAIDYGDLDKAKTVFEEHNWRLISESEWEYLAREGGNNIWTSVKVPKNTLTPTSRNKLELLDENAFGIVQLHEESIVADAWHNDYTNAPTNQLAWKEDNAEKYVARIGHTSWQDDIELIALHPAYRMQVSNSKEAQFFAVVDIIDDYQSINTTKSACSIEYIHKAIESGKNPQIKLAQTVLQEIWWTESFNIDEVTAVYEIVVSQLQADEKLLEGWLTVLTNMVVDKTELFFNDDSFNAIYVKHAPAFIPLLTHDKKKIRLKASLLALDFNNTEKTIQHFSDLVADEKNATMRGSLAIGIAYLIADSGGEEDTSLLISLTKDKNYTIKTCAAIGLKMLDKADKEVTELFLDGLTSKSYQGFPWFNGYFSDACMQLLAPKAGENIEDIIKDLVEYIHKNEDLYEDLMPAIHKMALSYNKLHNTAIQSIISYLKGETPNTDSYPWIENKLSHSDLYELLRETKLKKPLAVALELMDSKLHVFKPMQIAKWAVELVGFKEYSYHDGNKRDMIYDARKLTKDQRAVLEKVANLPEEDETSPTYDEHAGYHFCIGRWRQLPESHDSLKRWLGIAPPTVLEKEFIFEEGQSPEPLYLWANERWGIKDKTQYWDLLKSLMSDEELIEACLRFCWYEYPMVNHWSKLLDQVVSEFPAQQILNILNPMIDMYVSKGVDYCTDAGPRDNIHTYLELSPINEELRDDLAKIVRQLLVDERYYEDTVTALLHFPNLCKKAMTENLKKVKKGSSFSKALIELILYLSNHTDIEVCESLLKLGEGKTKSKFLPIMVYFIKGFENDAYNELIDKYEPQAEKFIQEFDFPEKKPTKRQTVDGKEVTAEFYFNDEIDIRRTKNYLLSYAAFTHSGVYGINQYKIDDKAEAAIRLIKKIGKVKTPVLFVDDKPIFDTKEIQHVFTNTFIKD